MKKTRCKYKGFYVIEHNDLPKNFYLLTLINFETIIFLLFTPCLCKFMVFMTYITLHRVPALSGILLRDGIYLPGGRQAGLVGAGYVHYVLT